MDTNDQQELNDELIFAARDGDLNKVKSIYESISEGTICAFLYAVDNGKFEVIEWMHEHKMEVANYYGYALNLAALNGNLCLVKWLHKHGAPVDSRDNEALRGAAKNGHIEIVKWLHEHGAHIAANNNQAIRLAYKNGHSHIVEYIKSQNGWLWTPTNK